MPLRVKFSLNFSAQQPVDLELSRSATPYLVFFSATKRLRKLRTFKKAPFLKSGRFKFYI